MSGLLFPGRRIASASAALLTLLCVFVLPYAFPPHRPAYSQSYVVGFNNRIAILCAGLLSIAVLLLLAGRTPEAAPGPVVPTSLRSRLRYPVPLLASSAVLLWIGAFCLLSLREFARVGESPYFLIQMEKVGLSHRLLYTQVEFAYGPLLFYPTLWLSRLFHGFQALDRAYDVTLLAHHLTGLWMLWFIVNRLPLTRAVRLVTFLSLGLYSLNPWMGLNYTLLRFLTPAFFITLLAAIDSPLLLYVVSFCAPIAALAVSPEAGFTLAFGAAVFCSARAWLNHDGKPLMGAVVALVGLLVGAAIAPTGMLSALVHFSNGFHQTPLLPSPGVLLILASAVWLAPAAVAAAFRSRASSFPLLIGLYAAALANLPVTLATTDSMHLLSNGIAFLLLAACFVSAQRSSERMWIFACPAVWILFFVQCVAAQRYGFTASIPCADPNHRAAEVLGHLSPRLRHAALQAEARGCPAPISPDQLPTAAQQGFTILSGADPHPTSALVRLSSYQPVYFANQINVWGPDAQQLLIRQIRQNSWLIAPSYSADHPVSPEFDNPLDLHPHLRQRHTIAPDDLIAAEISHSWQPVSKLSPNLWLYQRVR